MSAKIGCELCGRSMQARNVTGVCQRRDRDGVCRKEYRRRAYALKPKPVGKTCELCGSRLHSSNKTGICGETPQCRHEKNKRTYLGRLRAGNPGGGSQIPGFSRDELNRMREGKSCEVCGEIRKKMVVDHDHHTGKIRGVLCSQCNVAIGMMGDNVDRLGAAINYLRSTNREELIAA